MKFEVTLSGIDSLKDSVDLVKQKAEELEQAVQRLNDIEIGFKTSVQYGNQSESDN